MDAEETKTPANAEEKPAAKKRAPRKSAPRKGKEQTAPAAPAAESAPAPKAPRKPRTGKKATTPTVEKPADATPAQGDTHAINKQQRSPKKKAPTQPQEKQEQQPTPAQATAPAPAPAPAPTPRQAPPAEAPRQEQPEAKQDEAPKPQTPKQQQPQQQPRPQISDEQKFEVEFETRDFRAPEPAPGFAAPETVGGGEGNNGGGKNRRKRRRNRNRNRENEQNQQQPQFTPEIDTDELVRRAWKIYLGEVTEEGLALMDDRTATEASRRAFRVAEIFLSEAARHRRPVAPLPPEIELVFDDEDL